MSGLRWLLFVGYNRGILYNYADTNLIRSIKQVRNLYDIIVGPIADDTMEFAFPDFEEYRCTDVVLYRTLLSYGFKNQYTLISKRSEDHICVEKLSDRYIDFGAVTAAKKDYKEKRRYYYSQNLKIFGGVGRNILQLESEGIFDLNLLDVPDGDLL